MTPKQIEAAKAHADEVGVRMALRKKHGDVPTYHLLMARDLANDVYALIGDIERLRGLAKLVVACGVCNDARDMDDCPVCVAKELLEGGA